MKQILIVLGIITTLFGSWFFLDEHFASSGEVQTLTKDVRYIELWQLNQLIWKYEERYNCYTPDMCLPRMNEEDRDTYRKLQEDKNKLLDEIKNE